MDKFILRGVLSGALGGLIAFVFARIFAEPQIQAAIDYEEGRGAAQEKLDKAAGIAVSGHEHEIFSRTIQASLGIGVGMILLGAALGAIFAVVFAVCLGRVGKLKARSLALLLAGGGLVGFYLVPFVKYPANPPAVGNADTIGARTGLYLAMVVCSLLFLVLAVFLGRKLQARLGAWSASLVSGAAFIVAVGIVMLILPSLGELPANVAAFGHHATETPLPLTDPDGAIVYPGFPADVLADFRLYSVGAQVIIWGTIGLVFAPLADRLLTRLGTTAATKATANA
ncbi:putative cobalt transporter subunit CbtA [Antricoccus suffuscus]|uniref:Putative cobalt transporter subunit CbtA n=1 Tax=Antricoccus suffuscus TaxID=1629062 RepID=A0A2T0ZZE6_9ACTN|nr:CbtA family protein [Antricoccus suffuscus]PRZ41723.1 putative cobalt transporter subunit CbtA [Antricoccus suffuscus]